MITYIEKGEGLHLALNSAGIKVWFENRQVRVYPESKEAEAQSIIDDYDPVPYSRKIAKKRIVDQINESTKELVNKYPQVERDRFAEQEAEAIAFNVDPSALTPLIDEIVLRSGRSKALIASKIITRSNSRRLVDKAHLAERQKLFATIDVTTNYKAIDGLNFIADVV